MESKKFFKQVLNDNILNQWKQTGINLKRGDTTWKSSSKLVEDNLDVLFNLKFIES